MYLATSNRNSVCDFNPIKKVSSCHCNASLSPGFHNFDVHSYHEVNELKSFRNWHTFFVRQTIDKFTRKITSKLLAWLKGWKIIHFPNHMQKVHDTWVEITGTRAMAKYCVLLSNLVFSDFWEISDTSWPF